jgi:zinc/manganese transport system permease protein
MSAHALIIKPFESLAFMRAALVACAALALSNGAVGTLLVLRRMSLDGDVLGHAVMPARRLRFCMPGRRRRGCLSAAWQAAVPWQRWPG